MTQYEYFFQVLLTLCGLEDLVDAPLGGGLGGGDQGHRGSVRDLEEEQEQRR